MSLIQSLGQQLFSDEDSKDFTLIIEGSDKDESVRQRVRLAVHKTVLRTCSGFFRKHINGPKYFFAFVWFVRSECIPQAIRMIKFMYTRDLKDLGDINISAKLAVQLEMPELYNTLSMVRKLSNESEKPVMPVRKTAKVSRPEPRMTTRSKRPMILRSASRRKKRTRV